MRQPLKISVVTPSFNQGRFIDEAIRSVLEQGHPAFEHIIIDNCSSDGTLDVLKRYGHLNWISERDRGQSDALNRGFQIATGDVVGWLNADDRYLPGTFDAILTFLQSDPTIDLVYGDYRWVDERGMVLQNRKELEFDRFMLRYLHTLCIPTTSTFFRRRLFDEGNLLDISFHYAMDYEYFLRLARKGYRFAHLDGYLADFRWHGENKSNSELQTREFERAFLRHAPVLSAIPRPLRQVARATLTGIARAKRYALKSLHGHYLHQWRVA